MRRIGFALFRLTLLARLDQTNEQLLPQFQMATGEIGYADRRLGGASVWFIHNPNAISISYTYLVNVQLVFQQSPETQLPFASARPDL